MEATFVCAISIYALLYCVRCIVQIYSIWRLTHIIHNSLTLSSYFSMCIFIYWAATLSVWILLHLCLAFHSYRRWTRHAYWLLCGCVCAFACVFVYSKHRIYSIFWPSFIDFSIVVRQTHTQISKRCSKMLQAILRRPRVSANLWQRECIVYIHIGIVTVLMIYFMRKDTPKYAKLSDGREQRRWKRDGSQLCLLLGYFGF